MTTPPSPIFGSNEPNGVEDIFGAAATPDPQPPLEPLPPALPQTSLTPQSDTDQHSSVDALVAQIEAEERAAINSGPAADAPVPLTTVQQPEMRAVDQPIRRVGRGSRLRLLIVLAVTVCAGIVVAAFFIVRQASQTDQQTALNQNTATTSVTNTTTNTPTAVVTPTTVTDTDGDGLSDSEEAQLGTNPQTIDSDSDDLTDREEVRIYTTDPTDSDTDTDGYTDGNEVRQLYNPNGPGKLLDVKDLISNTSSTTP